MLALIIRPRLVLAVWTGLLVVSSPLRAQLTWGTDGEGGSGTWDGSTTNWYNGTSNVAWVPGDAATFTDSGGTVIVSGTQNASQLNFNSPLTLTGGTIQGTAGGLTIQANFDDIIDSSLVGLDRSSLTISAFSNFTLGGSVSGFGQVDVSEGDLIITNTAALNASTVYNLSNSAATNLTLAAGSDVTYLIGGLSGSGQVALEGGGTNTLVLGGSATSSYSGTPPSSGPVLAVTVDGASQTFSSYQAYTGATSVEGGSLTLSGNGELGESAVSVTGGTFVIDDSSANLPVRISSSNAFTMAGGTLLFQGNGSSASTELLGKLALPSGASTVIVNAGSGQTATVSFNGISAGGGTINFTGTGTCQISGASDTNGILGAYATVNSADWATVDSSGNVSAYSSYAGSLVTATATSNVEVPAGVLTTTKTINSLNQDNPEASTASISLDGNTLTLASGGLLSSGAGNNEIQTGDLTSSSGELLATVFNTEIFIGVIAHELAHVLYSIAPTSFGYATAVSQSVTESCLPNAHTEEQAVKDKVITWGFEHDLLELWEVAVEEGNDSWPEMYRQLRNRYLVE